ncbi:MAG TPA: hypothetical protein VJB57_04115 [Dehalococcoidia bacterium]|nr:hypothetical protein [Dehalococcoidia bacterium]
MAETAVKAPAHLRVATRRWYQHVVVEFDLESHHLRLLQLAAEAWDRATQAREALREAGSLTYLDRFGCPKARPEVVMERDARISFARLLRELGLDAAGTPEAPRPYGLRANDGKGRSAAMRVV